MERKNSFVLYSDYLEHFELLSDEDAGKLIKVILRYTSGGEIDLENLNPVAKMAFSFIKKQLDRDMKAYEIKCSKNRENGKLGGRPKKADGIDRNQMDNEKPNGFLQKHNDNDTDNGIENENDNDTVKKYSTGFCEFWKNYPRKVDKGNAYKKYQERLNDGYSEEELLAAAQRYAKECQTQHTESRYIKHPKTFLSDAMPFLDYIRKHPGTQETAQNSVDQWNPFARKNPFRR